MEMELGLKLTRANDEFPSTEFQFAKDRAGPLFQSTETDAMFILTAHLKGYVQKHINIDINEEGSIIAIRGEKPVQERVMVGWKLIRKDVEIRKFSKGFKIPDGVMLDKIKARFDEEISRLTIKMPKKVKGILGIVIEEVSSSENCASVTFKEEENQEKEKGGLEEKESEIQLPAVGVRKPDEELVKRNNVVKEKDTVQETRAPHVNSSVDGNKPESTGWCDESQASEEEVEISRKKEEDNVPKRSSIICVAAGSALLLSLLVFVMHFIRTKSQSGKRKD